LFKFLAIGAVAVAAFAGVNAVEASVAGFDGKTADETAQHLVQLIAGVIQPIGALLIFGMICYAGFKLVVTANKPDERAEVLVSLPYIAGGGVILGSVMLLAGFVISLMIGAGGGTP